MKLPEYQTKQVQFKKDISRSSRIGVDFVGSAKGSRRLSVNVEEDEENAQSNQQQNNPKASTTFVSNSVNKYDGRSLAGVI